MSYFLSGALRRPAESPSQIGPDPIHRRRLIVSYLPDWIISIALLGIVAGVTNRGGFKREFSLTDTSIQHTYAVTERVPFWEAIVVAGIAPAVIVVLWGAVWRRSIWDAHNGLLGLLLSLALTVALTDIIKTTVGRPRPDLIDRCQPIAGAINAIPYGLATVALCTRSVTSNIVIDGFKSFPSGHSSFAFSGLGYLSIYMAGKMHLFDKSGHAIKAWLCIIPLIGASLIAISRTMDNRHHATDVLIGGVLGFLMSLFSYHLYYPPLGSLQSHLPFSPRIPRSALDRPTSVPQESYLPEGTVPRPVEGRGVGAIGRTKSDDNAENLV